MADACELHLRQPYFYLVISARFCIIEPIVSMALAALPRISSVFFMHLHEWDFFVDFNSTAAPVPRAEPIIIPKAMYFAKQDMSLLCFVIILSPFTYYCEILHGNIIGI